MEPLSLIREVLLPLQFVTQPFFMCLSFVLLFERFAGRFGFMDTPDDRKRHDQPIPMVGGLAIYLATTLSIIVFVPHSITAVFIMIGGLVAMLGILDDRFDLPVRCRVVAQVLIAYLTVAYAGVEIHRIGNLVGMGAFELPGLVGVVFTMVCIVGGINAINMIDGVDGLAAGVSLLTVLGLSFLCWQGGYEVGMQMTLIFAGALMAFLCFNARVFVPRARVFLGDSGSTLLGYVLAWFFISLTQSGEEFVSSIVVCWLFGLPLIDTVSVMMGRVNRGVSPMTGGRDHLHHRLIDSGISVRRTVAIMLALHGALVIIGVASNGIPTLEPVLFFGFIALIVAYHTWAPALVRRMLPSPT